MDTNDIEKRTQLLRNKGYSELVIKTINHAVPICHEEFKNGCLSYVDKLRKKNAHLRLKHPELINATSFWPLVKPPNYKGRGG